MASVDLEWSHSIAHVLAPDTWMWPRGDVPGLELIDEDVSLLRDEDVTPDPRLNMINTILILTSSNFFVRSPTLKNCAEKTGLDM
jgi:hypothetical protein